ncbi:MAG TPA: four helix bundle protein [Saprospiraceae bacterium]|nr:four helix bundle protein [Saprospiraceae bacterium]
MSVIVMKTYDFGLKIIEFCHILEKEQRYVVNFQLYKAGTSIGANVREAQSPHSRSDFVAKMIVAMKEVDETEHWLLLCRDSPHLPDPGNLIDELSEIKKIIGKIILTSKKNAGVMDK